MLNKLQIEDHIHSVHTQSSRKFRVWLSSVNLNSCWQIEQLHDWLKLLSSGMKTLKQETKITISMYGLQNKIRSNQTMATLAQCNQLPLELACLGKHWKKWIFMVKIRFLHSFIVDTETVDIPQILAFAHTCEVTCSAEKGFGPYWTIDSTGEFLSLVFRLYYSGWRQWKTSEGELHWCYLQCHQQDAMQTGMTIDMLHHAIWCCHITFTWQSRKLAASQLHHYQYSGCLLSA